MLFTIWNIFFLVCTFICVFIGDKLIKKVRHSTFDWYGVAIPNFGLVWRPPYLPYRFRRPCRLNFEISPPGRTGIQELWHHGCTSYIQQCISIEAMSPNGVESEEGTRTFCNKSNIWWWNVRVWLTIPRTKYIHSVDSLNARYGNRIRKELSPTRKVNNHFMWLGVI